MDDILTPPFRGLYPELANPASYRLADGGESKPKYSVMAVWPVAYDGWHKVPEYKELFALLDSAAKGQFKRGYNKLATTVRKPIRPGLDKPSICGEDEIFASLRANVTHPPLLVAEDRSIIKDPVEITKAFGHNFLMQAVVHAWAYPTGVVLGLTAIQILDRTTQAQQGEQAVPDHFKVVEPRAGDPVLDDDDDFDDDIPF